MINKINVVLAHEIFRYIVPHINIDHIKELN